MIKKISLLFLLILILFGAWASLKILAGGTAFKGSRYFLYVKTGSNFDNLMETIRKDGVLESPGVFKLAAERLSVPQKLTAGKYEIKRGTSVLNTIRMLRNGRQSPVNLVITRLRTKNDFARFAGNQLECDSAAIMDFFNNPDSMHRFGLDNYTAMTVIIPNTYTMYWNTTPSKLFRKLHEEEQKFWNKDRLVKAARLELSPVQAYTLASIIEEETNKYDEMPLIASVYLNRLKKGMRLGADPTVKFASGDFAARRVTFRMIDESSESPYNTYKNPGLPPGPICTPSIETIDAVLSATDTDYLYFCAKPDFSGYHSFAATDAEHLKNARAYQRALDSLQIK